MFSSTSRNCKNLPTARNKVTYKVKFVYERVENIVERGENAGFHHFLLFKHCFQKPSFLGLLKLCSVYSKVLMTFISNLRALTFYRTILTFNEPGNEAFENIVGKGGNAGNQLFFPFPTMFSTLP